MNESETKRFVESLLSFIERASQKDATAAEVEALPAVAKVLAELTF